MTFEIKRFRGKAEKENSGHLRICTKRLEFIFDVLVEVGLFIPYGILMKEVSFCEKGMEVFLPRKDFLKLSSRESRERKFMTYFLCA